MVTTIVAFLLVYCYMLATTASAANTCAPEILDIVNGTPSGNRRTCSIAYHNSDVCAHVCTCPDSSCDESRSDVECPGFVGMNLTYECSFEGARLYKYQDGEYRYLNGSSVNYGLLLPEHAGLYECRNSTNHVVHAQNLTVNEGIRIGSNDTDCTQFPVVDDGNKCCSAPSTPWSVSDRNSKYQFAVYSNPEEYLNVTVEQIKWLVDEETRNDVDVGFHVEKPDSNHVIWSLEIKNIPDKVTRKTPQVSFRITAINANSSHSICSTAHFDLYGNVPESTQFQIENTGLPADASVPEGQEAVFQCSLSYTIGRISANFYALLEFSQPVQNMSETSERCDCTMLFTFYNVGNETRGNCSLPKSARFQRRTTGTSVAGGTILTLHISEVSANLSGSSVTCSLYHFGKNGEVDNAPGLLQWKRVAHLTVLPPAPVVPKAPSPAGPGSLVGGLVSALVVIIVVVSLATGTAVILRKRQEKRVPILHSDEVPLTGNNLRSSCSTLCESEPSTPITQTSRLPAIEIMSSGALSDGLLVGERLPNSKLTDTRHYDHRVCPVSTREDPSLNFPTNSPRPTGLQLLRDSQRALELLYDLSEFEEFVVYISYTDQMSEWVRNELKPLIESWHSVFRVNIHEDSMIPGFSVSGERHRLIFEADKIVIVVSSDYATSEWCVYELEHAIHQMPALCNGRVIPILTGSSNSLPRIISGVVSLNSTHTDFNTRLHQAILKKPNFMV